MLRVYLVALCDGRCYSEWKKSCILPQFHKTGQLVLNNKISSFEPGTDLYRSTTAGMQWENGVCEAESEHSGSLAGGRSRCCPRRLPSLRMSQPNPHVWILGMRTRIKTETTNCSYELFYQLMRIHQMLSADVSLIPKTVFTFSLGSLQRIGLFASLRRTSENRPKWAPTPSLPERYVDLSCAHICE